ncbi:hypothetical protein LXA43DRAFT_1062201 [Ganoderma leucocontextum]|nr:hypothetical protein LXA43DRAFT_1062201 [Ganoderma leucocontextum]
MSSTRSRTNNHRSTSSPSSPTLLADVSMESDQGQSASEQANLALIQLMTNVNNTLLVINNSITNLTTTTANGILENTRYLKHVGDKLDHVVDKLDHVSRQLVSVDQHITTHLTTVSGKLEILGQKFEGLRADFTSLHKDLAVALPARLEGVEGQVRLQNDKMDHIHQVQDQKLDQLQAHSQNVGQKLDALLGRLGGGHCPLLRSCLEHNGAVRYWLRHWLVRLSWCGCTDSLVSGLGSRRSLHSCFRMFALETESLRGGVIVLKNRRVTRHKALRRRNFCPLSLVTSPTAVCDRRLWTFFGTVGAKYGNF